MESGRVSRLVLRWIFGVLELQGLSEFTISVSESYGSLLYEGLALCQGPCSSGVVLFRIPSVAALSRELR